MLNGQTLTTQSDVYSFGITLWEIFSYGGNPYNELSKEDIVGIVKTTSITNKLDCPENCPALIYDIMIKCWRFNPKERPTFGKIIEELNAINRSLTGNRTRSVNYSFTEDPAAAVNYQPLEEDPKASLNYEPLGKGIESTEDNQPRVKNQTASLNYHPTGTDSLKNAYSAVIMLDSSKNTLL